MNKNYAIELFRGIAALLVVLSHERVFVFVDYTVVTSVGISGYFIKFFYLISSFGHQSVIIFFVISGFVIYDSSGEKISSAHFCYTEYLLSRIARLWIVLIPALLLTAGLDQITALNDRGFLAGTMDVASAPRPRSDGSVSTFVGNIIFLQAIILPTFGSNGPLWSLSHEFWYYVFAPIAWGLIRRFRLPNYSDLIACSMLLIIGYHFDLTVLYMSPIWFMGAHSARIRRTLSANLIIFGLFISATMVLFVLATTMKGQKIYMDIIDIATGIAFSLALTFMPTLPVALRKISMSLGGLSYSLYLTHFPVVCLFWTLCAEQKRATVSLYSFAIFFGATITAISTAWIFRVLFEMHYPVVRKGISRYFNRETQQQRTQL